MFHKQHCEALAQPAQSNQLSFIGFESRHSNLFKIAATILYGTNVHHEPIPKWTNVAFIIGLWDGKGATRGQQRHSVITQLPPREKVCHPATVPQWANSGLTFTKDSKHHGGGLRGRVTLLIRGLAK